MNVITLDYKLLNFKDTFKAKHIEYCEIKQKRLLDICFFSIMPVYSYWLIDQHVTFIKSNNLYCFKSSRIGYRVDVYINFIPNK